MPYTLPTFNLTVNVWNHRDPASGLPVGAPDLVESANLQYGRKTDFGKYDHMSLLLPAFTDVRNPLYISVGVSHYDIIECVAGTSVYWLVTMVNDVAKGFTNEYRVATIVRVAYYYPSVAAFADPIPLP